MDGNDPDGLSHLRTARCEALRASRIRCACSSFALRVREVLDFGSLAHRVRQLAGGDRRNYRVDARGSCTGAILAQVRAEEARSGQIVHECLEHACTI